MLLIPPILIKLINETHLGMHGSYNQLDIIYLINIYYDIVSLLVSITFYNRGNTIVLYISLFTPYNFESLEMLSPTVIFNSTLSFSRFDFSLFPYILIHKLFISVRLFNIQFIESVTSPPFFYNNYFPLRIDFQYQVIYLCTSSKNNTLKIILLMDFKLL